MKSYYSTDGSRRREIDAFENGQPSNQKKQNRKATDMEIDLNELARLAKAAGAKKFHISIDATGDAFLSAENGEYIADIGAVGEEGLVSDYGRFIVGANPAVVLELVHRLRESEKDAERYRLLRRGQHWSTINGIGETLRADLLDASIDAVMGLQPPKGEDCE